MKGGRALTVNDCVIDCTLAQRGGGFVSVGDLSLQVIRESVNIVTKVANVHS